MFIDAWWFNNTQTHLDALFQDPDWPDEAQKTHMGVFFQDGTLELPVQLGVAAFLNGEVVFEKEFTFADAKSQNDTCECDMSIKEGGSILDCRIFTKTLPVPPEKIQVSIHSGGQHYKKEITCAYATLSGTITDFKGKPYPSPIIFRRTGFENGFRMSYMWVWSNTDGTYSVTIPHGVYHHFFICDNQYGKSVLEYWGWHMIVDRDEQHNFKIGTGEVYSLAVWPNNGGFATLFIYFRPMILHKNVPHEVEINGTRYTGNNISPKLEMKDLSVTLNGCTLENISLQEIYETSPSGYIMPAYILQVKRYPDSAEYTTTEKQTLVVEYDTVDEDGYTATSMGSTQFFYHNGYATTMA